MTTGYIIYTGEAGYNAFEQALSNYATSVISNNVFCNNYPSTENKCFKEIEEKELTFEDILLMENENNIKNL